MSFKTLHDFDLSDKTVLLRADLNVPVQDGKISDFTRIDRLKPTIDYLNQNAKRIIILSHYGRPKGEVNNDYSLSFLPETLSTHWETQIGFDEDSDTKITLKENLRFHKGEEANDKDFAKALAALGDVYINDAFSCAHRAHASTEGITHLLPSGAGLLMEAELNALSDALENPEKPVMAIVGGAKISTKLSVLHNLVKKVDYLVLGGGMANTFLFANNQMVGKSLCEEDMVNEARQIERTAKENNCEIILPKDCVIVSELKEGTESSTTALPHFPEDKMAVDAGVESIKNVCDVLDACKTVLWNGPFGVFEIKPFDNATNQVAKKVAQMTKDKKLISVAGGGDTVSALDNAGVIDDFSYISTAGGAFLEWLEGKELPGVAALSAQNKKAA